jgi:hypothetical protein
MFLRFLLLGLASAADLAPGEQKEGPRVLTTSELTELLPGTYILQDEVPDLQNHPEEFHKNGEYVRWADNSEDHGRFRIRDNMLCTVAEREPELCRFIIEAMDGEYWLVSLPQKRLRKISITNGGF